MYTAEVKSRDLKDGDLVIMPNGTIAIIQKANYEPNKSIVVAIVCKNPQENGVCWQGFATDDLIKFQGTITLSQ